MTADDREELGRLVDALAQSAFETMGVVTRIGSSHDLSLTQVRLLAILRDRRVRMSELGDHLGLEKSTVTGLISRAEARGLVQRTPSSTDGRAVDVRLSDDGKRLADELTAMMHDSFTPMSRALTEPERVHLRTLLERIMHIR